MDTEHTTSAQSQSHVMLARVKNLLARLDAERKAGQSQSARKSLRPYTADPRLTAPDLAAWEAANGVVLPEAYRLFLLEIGNGGFMPGDYCDFKMRPLDPRRVDARLREPFPLSRDRFERQIARPQTGGERYEPPFPELSKGPEESEDGEALPPGCLQLGRYPGYDPVYLIVNGDLYGTVWCVVEGWVPELDRQGKPFDFLGWFEDALVDLGGVKWI